MTWSKEEFKSKLIRVRELMNKEDIDVLVLNDAENFLWLTGGRPYVNITAPKACADLVVTVNKVYLLTNNIEEKRLAHEEILGLPMEIIAYNWWEETAYEDKLFDISREKKVFTDSELGVKFARLRWELTPQEMDCYRETGVLASKILEKIAYELKPGDTELEVAQRIKQVSCKYDFNTWVVLVGADERAYKYRHPLPTKNTIENYVLLAISGHKYGLMTSVTRLVHFGEVPKELSKRHQAVLKVDVAFIGATKPGVKVKDVFEEGKRAYTDVGYSDEWRYHHQGGMAGYNSREFRATSHCEEVVRVNQAYAWNPTIAGAKSEDTILITEKGHEIITKAIDYPTVEIEYKGVVIPRAEILVR